MRIALLCSLFLVAGCGGSSPTSPSGPGSGSGSGSGSSTPAMSALVDGVAWNATVSSRATYQNGILSVTGQDSALRVITMAVTLSSTGTYSLDFPAAGRIASMTISTNNWTTAGAGGQGTLTVNTFTANQVSGTFALTMVPSQLNAAGSTNTSRVTSGQFTLTLERF